MIVMKKLMGISCTGGILLLAIKHFLYRYDRMGAANRYCITYIVFL